LEGAARGNSGKSPARAQKRAGHGPELNIPKMIKKKRWAGTAMTRNHENQTGHALGKRRTRVKCVPTLQTLHEKGEKTTGKTNNVGKPSGSCKKRSLHGGWMRKGEATLKKAVKKKIGKREC